MFERPPVKRIETTAEARLARADENLLPWVTERLDVLGYNPAVVAFYEGEALVVRICMALMPMEASEKGWAELVLSEAIAWARTDPRLVKERAAYAPLCSQCDTLMAQEVGDGIARWVCPPCGPKTRRGRPRTQGGMRTSRRTA